MHTRTGGKQFVCSIRSELSTNSTWMYGSLDSWHNGCMTVWIHGTMDAWQFGFMALWMHGSLDSWHNGCMAVWIHGTMDAWQFGFMAQWIYGSLDSSPRCDGLDTRTPYTSEAETLEPNLLFQRLYVSLPALWTSLISPYQDVFMDVLVDSWTSW